MSEYIHWQDDSGLYKRGEIARCRDCKHATGGGTCCWHFAYDELDGYNEWISQPADVEPDGFCAWGERR